MPAPDPLDEDARWRAAAERAVDVPSDGDLAGSTRACLAVIAIGLSMAVVAVTVFFGAPAALDTLVLSIAMTALLVALFAIGAWAYVKRFRRISPRGMVSAPLTPPERRVLRAYVRNPAEAPATRVPALLGHLRQQRHGLVNAGLFVGFWIGLSAYSVATSHPSGLTVFWFCYLVGGPVLLTVGVVLYRRYGAALDRVQVLGRIW